MRSALRYLAAAVTCALAGLGVFAPLALANPTYRIMNAPEGVYWRSAPDWYTPVRQNGFGVYNGEIIEPHCYQTGAENVPGSKDWMWEYASDVTGPGYGTGWVNEHFIEDGQPIDRPSPGVPPCNPPAPTVSTGSASGVGQTSAELTGSVNPNGGNVTDCHFEYGPTSSYGSTVGCSPAPGSGEGAVGVRASIGGLAASSNYHFRIVATNSGGTNYGSDQSFNTLPSPPAVVTGTATSVLNTSATFGATVNPEGGNVADCHFEYGPSPSYGASVPCSTLPGSGSSPVEVSASTSSLMPNTTYYVRIVATNSGGTSYGSQASFATLPNPPAVVTGMAASISQTTATPQASVNPEGGNVTACTFEYGTSPAYGSSVSCASLPGSGSTAVGVSSTLAGLVANTTYYFRIVATNAGGTSYGSEGMLSTLPNLPTVTASSATAIAPYSATLNGAVNPNGGNVTSCTFEYGTTSGYGSSLPCESAVGSGETAVATSAAIAGLIPGTTYHFRVVATNSGGTTDGADGSFVTAPPPPPPTVTELSPANGPAAGGTAVTITGTNFYGVTGVKFGASAAKYVVNSATSISAITPPEQSGSAAVTVTTRTGTSKATTATHFKYEAPTVASIAPEVGPVSGGTEVTVIGTGFSKASGKTIIKFGRNLGTSVACSTTSKCTVVAPPSTEGKLGPVEVVVTVRGLTSKKNPLTDAFTYN